MNIEEGKQTFIQAWGTLGSDWGVNRTMAQVHALLLVSAKPLSAKDIMDQLKISIGNANMNIRALIDWGLVYKKIIPGERKDYFIAEKDMWDIIKKIIAQRKKKELDPMKKVLTQISEIEGEGEEVETFKSVVQDIQSFSNKADNALEKLIRSDESWFLSTLIKLMK